LLWVFKIIIKLENQIVNIAGQGCLILIGIIVVLVIIISSCVNMAGSDSDSDCNDSYIEQVYNGDREEDAEDFRIQTEGC
jgi:hypothetical protein